MITFLVIHCIRSIIYCTHLRLIEYTTGSTKADKVAKNKELVIPFRFQYRDEGRNIY